MYMKPAVAFLLVVGAVVAEKNVKTQQDPIKQAYLKRQARQAESTTAQTSTIATPSNTAEACSSEDCGGRGTCFGTKQSPICLCQLGYAGTRCEDTYCDSARDCNGHGLCMGTQRQFTCLCNLGFGGERCETEVASIVTLPTTVTAPAGSASETTPTSA